MTARGRQRRPARSAASATTGGSAASSTRSIRAASPTATATAIGDLRGIIDHLDHLGPDGLGVDAIWLSPIYPSPGHRRRLRRQRPRQRSIPLFGTEADFDRLVAEAHRRGIRVVLDLVMNHTSDQHPWFEASRARSARRPYADWYLWRDPAGDGPDGRAAAAEQLGVVVRRPGVDLRPRPRPVLPPHVPGRAARARLAASRRSRRPSSTMVRGLARRAASTASGSIPSTSSSSTRRCAPIRRDVARPLGTARSTLRLRPAGPAGARRAVPGGRRR